MFLKTSIVNIYDEMAKDSERGEEKFSLVKSMFASRIIQIHTQKSQRKALQLIGSDTGC